ncbi:MAG: hypothetical protein ACRDMV_25160 [Streptosporangiales bacterium]
MARRDGHWERLGDEVRRARVLAGHDSAADFGKLVGVSGRTVLALERGEPVADRTLIRVATALGWPNAACERILAGEDPQLVLTSARPSSERDATVERIREDLAKGEEMIRSLPLSDADRAKWISRLHARTEQRVQQAAEEARQDAETWQTGT